MAEDSLKMSITLVEYVEAVSWITTRLNEITMAITVASLSIRELNKNLTLSNWAKANGGRKMYRISEEIIMKITNKLK